MNEIVIDWPSFRAMVSGLRESPMPVDKELAGQIEAFIAEWEARQRARAAQ